MPKMHLSHDDQYRLFMIEAEDYHVSASIVEVPQYMIDQYNFAIKKLDEIESKILALSK
jgi:hypothetical protein